MEVYQMQIDETVAGSITCQPLHNAPKQKKVVIISWYGRVAQKLIARSLAFGPLLCCQLAQNP